LLPRISLKYILFTTFTLIASLPVLILAGWVQQSALDNEISSVEEKHLLVAQNLTGDLERYVIDVESSFKLVSNNLIKGVKVVGLPEHLDSLFLRYIRITDAEGVINKQITALSKVKEDQFSSKSLKLLLPIMKIAHDSPETIFYSNLVRTGEDETTFYLIKAAENEQYVIGALSTTHILEAQQKVSFGRRGHAAIVDRTGRAIAHPIPDWVKTMKDMSFLPPVKKMMQGETGVSKFYTPAMQADMVAGYTSVPRSGWGVMIPQPYEELEEHANDVQFIALTIALIGIAISGFISWFIASLLCNPIQSVVDATEVETDGRNFPLASSVITTQRFIPHELRILLNSFNLMRTNLNTLTSQLHSKIDLANSELEGQNLLLTHQSKQLKETNKQLEVLTCTDSLTELFNRRHFDSVLDNELSHAKRHNESFSLMMIDLDNFKHTNDKYGHSAGDKVLSEIAKVIIDNVRPSDVVCRVGGEEFAIIFRQTDNQEVRIVAETLRNKMEQHSVMIHDQQAISVTASIGVATFPADSAVNYTRDQLYKHADTAMYHSKNNGKNQTTHFDDVAETVSQNAN
jgi:diguanylate cyclase (GGDEF)-like protein